MDLRADRAAFGPTTWPSQNVKNVFFTNWYQWSFKTMNSGEFIVQTYFLHVLVFQTRSFGSWWFVWPLVEAEEHISTDIVSCRAPGRSSSSAGPVYRDQTTKHDNCEAVTPHSARMDFTSPCVVLWPIGFLGWVVVACNKVLVSSQASEKKQSRSQFVTLSIFKLCMSMWYASV